jgi:hypothetical protein
MIVLLGLLIAKDLDQLCAEAAEFQENTIRAASHGTVVMLLAARPIAKTISMVTAKSSPWPSLFT